MNVSVAPVENQNAILGRRFAQLDSFAMIKIIYDVPQKRSSNTLLLKSKESDDDDEPNSFGQVLKKTAETLDQFFWQSIGIAAAIGIVLNLCGYGYTIDWEHGLEIGKMGDIRTEMQFRREVERSSKMAKPPALKDDNAKVFEFSEI